jgi:hypothetical protein
MVWITPRYEELKMDAEIGSYQEDGERDRESPLFAQREPTLNRTDTSPGPNTQNGS